MTKSSDVLRLQNPTFVPTKQQVKIISCRYLYLATFYSISCIQIIETDFESIAELNNDSRKQL